MMRLPLFLQLAFSFLLWLQLFPSTLALYGDSGCNRYMCVNATLNEKTITYELTGLHEPLGWLAIGTGYRMDHSDMVIVWPNSHDGSIILSQRFGWGHEMPSVLMNPFYRAHVVDPVPTSWCPPNSTRMAFEITYNQTAMELDKVQHLIWAYGMTRPNVHSWDILYGHYSAGLFKLNFSKEAIPPPPPGSQPMPLPTSDNNNMDHHNHNGGNVDTSEDQNNNGDSIFNVNDVPLGHHEKIIVAHAVILATAFLVFLPAGSLVARWSRTVTPKWLRVHSFINMTVALPIIILGWLLGPIAVFTNDGEHLSTAHQVCGVILVALYLLQVWLGRYIHRRRAEGLVPNNKPHPPSNILHVVLGLSVIALAFFQVRSGLDEWESATHRGPLHAWCHDLWLAWIVVVPIAYLAGLSLVPRQFYQERQHIMPGGSISYTPLPDGADSPLLNDRDGIYEQSGGEFKNTRVSMDEVRVAAAEK